MQEFGPGADGLTDERIPRLHLIERIEGNSFEMTVDRSEIITEGEDEPTSVDLEIDVDNWLVDEMDDVVEASDCGMFLKEAGVKRMRLEGVQIDPDGPYLIQAPMMVVRQIHAEADDEEEDIHMGSTQIPHIIDGCRFPPMGNDEGTHRVATFRGEPCFDMPMSVIRALYDSDIRKLDRLKKRISKFPGEFAVEKHNPQYLAAFNGEKKEMTWRI